MRTLPLILAALLPAACGDGGASPEAAAAPAAGRPAAPAASAALPAGQPAAPAAADFDFTPGGPIPDADLAAFQVVMECAIDERAAGAMVFEFWPEKAPVTVRNFLRYAAEGFYDGVTFHRIVKGFMIQGGDPTGTGSGQGRYGTILGEFTSNPAYTLKEIASRPKYKHLYGVLSMARSRRFDSGSCQFFVCNAKAEALDGNYASFGKLVAGEQTLEALSNVPVGRSPGGEMSVPQQSAVIVRCTVRRKEP